MHRRAARLLDDYVSGALSRRDAVHVEDHVAVCAACRSTLAELRKTVELLHGLRDGLDFPDLTESVLTRIRRGEADTSRWDRFRAHVSRFLAGPLGAPLATATIGVLLLAVLPRIEVEIRIPGRAGVLSTDAALGAPTARAPHAGSLVSGPLLARRVNESLSREPSRLARPLPLDCLETSSVEPCRDQHALMTQLAMDNIWAFLAEIEQVPEPSRDVWLRGLSRYAADSGDAADVAARLRATGDPRAQRLAIRFEEAR